MSYLSLPVIGKVLLQFGLYFRVWKCFARNRYDLRQCGKRLQIGRCEKLNVIQVAVILSFHFILDLPARKEVFIPVGADHRASLP